MSIRETTKSILRQWAGVASVGDQQDLCIIWAAGGHGVLCEHALPGLVASIKAAFPDFDLSDLSPSDLKSPGQITTVDSLVAFIGSSPMEFTAPLAVGAGGELNLAVKEFKGPDVEEAAEKPSGRARKSGKGSKKGAKKGTRKGTKKGTKKAEKDGEK